MEIRREAQSANWLDDALSHLIKTSSLNYEGDSIQSNTKRNYSTLEEGLEDLLSRAHEKESKGLKTTATEHNVAVRFAGDSFDIFDDIEIAPKKPKTTSPDSLNDLVIDETVFGDNDTGIPTSTKPSDKERLQKEQKRLELKIEDLESQLNLASEADKSMIEQQIQSANARLKTIEQQLDEVDEGDDEQIQAEADNLLREYKTVRNSILKLEKQIEDGFDLLNIDPEDDLARDLLRPYAEDKSGKLAAGYREILNKSSRDRNALGAYLNGETFSHDDKALQPEDEIIVTLNEEEHVLTVEEIVRYKIAKSLLKNQALLEVNKTIKDNSYEKIEKYEKEKLNNYFKQNSLASKRYEKSYLIQKKKLGFFDVPENIEDMDLGLEENREIKRLYKLLKDTSVTPNPTIHKDFMPKQEKLELSKIKKEGSPLSVLVQLIKKDVKRAVRDYKRSMEKDTTTTYTSQDEEDKIFKKLNKDIKRHVTRHLVDIGWKKTKIDDFLTPDMVADVEALDTYTIIKTIVPFLKAELEGMGLIGDFKGSLPQSPTYQRMGDVASVKPPSIIPNVPPLYLPDDIAQLSTADRKKKVHQCPDYKQAIGADVCLSREHVCSRNDKHRFETLKLLKEQGVKLGDGISSEQLYCPICAEEIEEKVFLLPVRCSHAQMVIESHNEKYPNCKEVSCGRRVPTMSFLDAPEAYTRKTLFQDMSTGKQGRTFTNQKEALEYYVNKFKKEKIELDKFYNGSKKDENIKKKYFLPAPGSVMDDGTKMPYGEIYKVTRFYNVKLEKGKVVPGTEVALQKNYKQELLAKEIDNPQYIHSILKIMHNNVMLESYELPEERSYTKGARVDRSNLDFIESENIPKNFKNTTLDRETYVCGHCGQFIAYGVGSLKANETYNEKILNDFNTLYRKGRNKKYVGVNLTREGTCPSPECGVPIATMQGGKYIAITPLYWYEGEDKENPLASKGKPYLKIVPSYAQRVRYTAYGWSRCGRCGARYIDNTSMEDSSIVSPSEVMPRDDCPICGFDKTFSEMKNEYVKNVAKYKDSTDEKENRIYRNAKAHLDRDNFANYEYQGRLNLPNNNISIMTVEGVERFITDVISKTRKYTQDPEKYGEQLTTLVFNRVLGYQGPMPFGGQKKLLRRDEFYKTRYLYKCDNELCGHITMYPPLDNKCQQTITLEITQGNKVKSKCQGEYKSQGAYRCNMCNESLPIDLAYKLPGDLQCPYEDCGALIKARPFIHQLEYNWKCPNKECEEAIPTDRVVNLIYGDESAIQCHNPECMQWITRERLFKNLHHAGVAHCPTCQRSIEMYNPAKKKKAQFIQMLENKDVTVCIHCGQKLNSIERTVAGFAKTKVSLPENSSAFNDFVIDLNKIGQTLEEEVVEDKKDEKEDENDVILKKSDPKTESVNTYAELRDISNSEYPITNTSKLLYETEADEIQNKVKEQIEKRVSNELGVSISTEAEKEETNVCYFWPKYYNPKLTNSINPADINSPTRYRTVEKCLNCEKEDGRQTIFYQIDDTHYIVYEWKEEGSDKAIESLLDESKEIENNLDKLEVDYQDLTESERMQKPYFQKSCFNQKKIDKMHDELQAMEAELFDEYKKENPNYSENKVLNLVSKDEKVIEFKKQIEEAEEKNAPIHGSLLKSVGQMVEKQSSHGRCPIADHETDSIVSIGKPREIASNGSCLSCVVPECPHNIINKLVDHLSAEAPEGFGLSVEEAEVLVTKLGPNIIRHRIDIDNTCEVCNAPLGNQTDSKECANVHETTEDGVEIDVSERETADVFDIAVDFGSDDEEASKGKEKTEEKSSKPKGGTSEDFQKAVPQSKTVMRQYLEKMKDEEYQELIEKKNELLKQYSSIGYSEERLQDLAKRYDNVQKYKANYQEALKVIEKGESDPRYENAMRTKKDFESKKVKADKIENLYKLELDKREKYIEVRQQVNSIEARIQDIANKLTPKRFRSGKMRELQEIFARILELKGKIEGVDILTKIDQLDKEYRESGTESLKAEIELLEKELKSRPKEEIDKYKEQLKVEKQKASELSKQVYALKSRLLNLIKTAEYCRGRKMKKEANLTLQIVDSISQVM